VQYLMIQEITELFTTRHRTKHVDMCITHYSSEYNYKRSVPFKRRSIKHTDAPCQRKCEAAKQQAMCVKRFTDELSSNYSYSRKHYVVRILSLCF
jgi:hypothetical protein